MILTVEGPSAAGKTTWVYKHFSQSLISDEVHVEGAPSDESDPKKAALFWAEVSKQRWTAVCTKETETGLVVCDSDPFKLHYVWSLWRLGKVGAERWRAEMSATRKLFANDELGVSDVILVHIPDQAVLEWHAKSDSSRSRPNFALHSQLAEPLRDWYKAIEQIDPNRVHWKFSNDDLKELELLEPRQVRSGTELFDKIMTNLPAI